MSAASLLLRHPAVLPGGRLRQAAAVLACLLLGVLASPAGGQEAEMLATDGSLTIEVHKGRVIRLPRPAATVFVADPEIADVQAQSASIVYLFGRRTGSTSLYAIDENDQLLLRTAVVVSTISPACARRSIRSCPMRRSPSAPSTAASCSMA
jgi:Flp pilus assembly secretin CpaC